ncbi:hypothetical protein ACFQUU_03750 [Herbaspirillum sp. GCM10030257]|uniref:hypothetical protein n=1 Tax=Herbaspirillum sp. GCM10030257 TaxID=3273393 RepID=UPI003619B48D
MRHLILLLPIALAACASTGSGGSGGIAVDTVAGGQSLPGANCMVSTNAGSWNVVTPATVSVGSPSGDLRVVCNKTGYRTSEIIYKPSNPLGSSVGLGAGGGGGNVGVGVGLSFPIRLGGGSYPSHVTVDMNPQ